MGGRAYSVKKKRPEIREKQAKYENASYYALKNITWEQNRWGRGWDMGAAVVNCVLSSTPNRKDFPISRFFSLLHCRTLSIPEKHLFWHKEQVLIISSMPNFPPIEGMKEKKSSLLWTLDEQEYGCTKYLATLSQ